MVKYKDRYLDHAFFAFANPVRRFVLRKLSQKTHTISELFSHCDISFPAFLKHLQVLEQARLIRRKKHGRSWHLTLCAGPMADTLKWLRAHCPSSV